MSTSLKTFSSQNQFRQVPSWLFWKGRHENLPLEEKQASLSYRQLGQGKALVKLLILAK